MVVNMIMSRRRRYLCPPSPGAHFESKGGAECAVEEGKWLPHKDLSVSKTEYVGRWMCTYWWPLSRGLLLHLSQVNSGSQISAERSMTGSLYLRDYLVKPNSKLFLPPY